MKRAECNPLKLIIVSSGDFVTVAVAACVFIVVVLDCLIAQLTDYLLVVHFVYRRKLFIVDSPVDTQP